MDLNRNFPFRWAPRPHGTYYPGPRAASEPETRALMKLVRRVKPQLGIYYHQHMGITVRAPAGDLAVEREYARRTGLPLRSLPAYHGTAGRGRSHRAREHGVRGGAPRRPRACGPARQGGARARASVPCGAVKIVLVRHGETEWSASGKHTSRTDVPLTDAGRAAARELGSACGRGSSRSCSPRRARGRGTRRAEAGFDAVVDEDLAEWDYGGYEGLTTPEIRVDRPGWLLWDDGVPGGETATQVAARVDRVIERALAADGDVALFAHGHILRVLGARWLDLPAQRGGSLALDTASMSELGFEHENRVIWHWNQSAPPST